jgi:hypothetical protein
MSALLRIADSTRTSGHVRDVPEPEVATSVAPSQAEHRSVAWLGGQASYWHIATRVTAKQRITTMFDRPETDLFQKSRALAQYLPRIAM